MNAQDTATTMWAWRQASAAKRAQASAKAAWVANPTQANWTAWQNAEDRAESVQRAANVVVKQVVMQNDAARAW